jgi:hypothetical protein
VRIAGKIYTAYENLFKLVNSPGREQFVEDDWVLMTCQAGNRAYIYFPDVTVQGPKDTAASASGVADVAPTFVSGISDTGPGQEGHGTARDLTEQEAIQLEKERGASRK